MVKFLLLEQHIETMALLLFITLKISRIIARLAKLSIMMTKESSLETASQYQIMAQLVLPFINHRVLHAATM